MPECKVDGWKCSNPECGYEWRLRSFEIQIVTCNKCQNKEINTYPNKN